MLELSILAIFSISLILCLIIGKTVLYALCFGLLLFFGYGMYKLHNLRAVLNLCLKGISSISAIIEIFLLIGMLTAFWHMSGTIALIVEWATRLFSPHSMPLVSFLLCCFMSVLTGTSFGTVATMGIICSTAGATMGISPVYMGGAIISGIYFGDRCSPVSSSCVLVANVTNTNIYTNIKNMLRSGMLPFIISCALYFALGLIAGGEGEVQGVTELFEEFYNLNILCIAPAVLIILLSLLRIDSRLTLVASCATAAFLALFLQSFSIGELAYSAFYGYTPEDARLAEILGGGGILGMLNLFFIILISSCYAGIFRGTGFLDGIRDKIAVLSQKISPFGAILLTSYITAMISCSQALSVILTNQLCCDIGGEDEEFAHALENTSILMPVLVPWATAAAIPLTAMDAPTYTLLFAWYVYLIPLFELIKALKKHFSKANLPS